MNETGSANVSSLREQRGGDDQCRHRDQCQQREMAERAAAGARRVVSTWPGSCVDPSRAAAAPAGPSGRGVVAAVAVPAEHGDVSAALVSEALVGAVVDREPAA